MELKSVYLLKNIKKACKDVKNKFEKINWTCYFFDFALNHTLIGMYDLICYNGKIIYINIRGGELLGSIYFN